MKIILPKKEHIVKTGRTDPVGLHYVPLVRYFLNKRLALALSLFPQQKFNALLDAGCGGGISLPELSRRCESLYAIDIHDHLDQVQQMAQAEGIRVDIKESAVDNIKFAENSFDGIFCLSVLEFVADLPRVFDEFYRVTKPGGTLILGFPVINFLTDLGYLAIKITNARALHQSTHLDILRQAQKRFVLQKLVKFPFFLPGPLGLFLCCKLKKI
jgi:ubiquinone/menaquinone biosynthesis C-methylase UbiE